MRSDANSIAKYDKSKIVEVLEKNGIYYYTLIDGEYKTVEAVYTANGKKITAITSNLSDEAIDALISIKLN